MMCDSSVQDNSFVISLSVATYNCVSLNDSVAYRKRYGMYYREKGHRSVQMENAILDIDVSIFGFQETRNPPGRSQSDNFIKISSGHLDFNLGRTCGSLVSDL